jgi:RNA polymerase sigma-70 factor (ECF subfamily)
MNESRPSDNELIRLIAREDSHAFDLLYSRYGEMIRGHLLRMIRDTARAEDLLQEVFLRLWENAARWDERGKLKSWLYRVATNLALNHLRWLRRRKERTIEFVKPGERDEAEGEMTPSWMVDASSLGPDVLAEQMERRILLNRLVDELPESKREAIRLVYDAGMEIQEAAEKLGVPAGTVKSRLHYAAKKLARKWEEIEG